MGKDPKIISTDLGNGLMTLVPYGVSKDVSPEMRKALTYISKLARAKGRPSHRRSR
jgi:hypothetical protein